MSLQVSSLGRKKHSMSNMFEGQEAPPPAGRTSGSKPKFGKGGAVGRQHDHLMNVAQIQNAPKKAEAEEIDIDFTDPEVADAATKIQAGFRGMQGRKAVKAKQSAKADEPKSEFEAKKLWQEKADAGEHVHEMHEKITRRKSVTDEQEQLHEQRTNVSSHPKPYIVGPGGVKAVSVAANN